MVSSENIVENVRIPLEICLFEVRYSVKNGEIAAEGIVDINRTVFFVKISIEGKRAEATTIAIIPGMMLRTVRVITP